LAVTAGLKTLEILRRPDTYERLEDVSNQLATGLAAAAAKAGVPLTVNRVGSMFTCFFKSDSVTDYASAKKADTAKFARFFRSLLDRGVYFPPSQFEAAFVSTAHTESDVVRTVEAAAKAFEEIW
jgi:glutamate-1-semialdehyde 2,1-aminomutase